MCKPVKSRTPAPKAAPAPLQKTKVVTPTHSTHLAHKRNTDYDVLFFLAPALCWSITPVMPIYITGMLRIVSTHLVLSLHYIFVDKDNYDNKLSQKQLRREKDDYLVGSILHMWTQVVLQIIFPGMFFADSSEIWSCAVRTFWCHILVVEPLYYFAHRWLHIPKQMKAMHGFHHLSINTLPSTSLVQNFEEHFVYIATFGPAFFFPFITGGCQHWAVIGAYLVLFDLINAFGHTNIRLRSWIFTHKYSPLRYLFYTPEFHLGHHAYFNANYSLFMPLWDCLLGTYREYKKPPTALLPYDQQDFVFIGHNGGLGHLVTCPEVSVYNVYDSYRRTFLPIEVEFFLMHLIGCVARMVMRWYYCSRYLVDQRYIGRIICVLRTPWDYCSPKRYGMINKDIVSLIRDQYRTNGTRYFGLGNLNKMKQLNDGGAEIVKLVEEDPFLKDKNIRVWTGDTMTAASIYNQIADIPDLNEIFFIGANGKVGSAVCKMLLKTRPNFNIRVYSRYQGIEHPNITYTADLSEITKYKVVVVGKLLAGRQYRRAFQQGCSASSCKTRFILDYTVPFIPIEVKDHPEIQHIQIGLLRMTDTSNNSFLKGHYDVCMGHDENHIYPCHAGCLMNMVARKETNEIGDIDLDDMNIMWKQAMSYGFRNRTICY